jgi:two-component system cell cycle sensor histidine kinase/response regulator CckA
MEQASALQRRGWRAMNSRAVTYGAAIVAVIVATLLRIALAPVLGNGLPFGIFFAAVLIAVWYGGFGPAVVSIVLSTAVGTYLFVSRDTTSPFLVSSHADRATAFGFALISLAAAFLIDLQRKTLKRVEQESARRLRAEQAEREQREWFETTLASIGDGVIATDGEGRVTFMNSVATALTGWETEQARGSPLRTVFRIVNELNGNEADNPVETVIREGVTVGLANHTLLISRDGRHIPLEDCGAPIRRDGRILGAVLVFRDATENRTARRAIENSERRYRLLFESNPQPMWVYDRESLAFLAVNTAAVHLYGYPAEEFLRMTLKDIRPAEDVPALLEDVRQPGGAFHRDGPWRHRKRDGTIISVEIASHPILYEGRDARLILATDITERQKLQEQFQQAQRLESIGRLAGGVAHDFNNLLTVINGYAAQVLSDLPPGSALARRVAEIGAAGQRAAALTQQLLAFSRRQLVQLNALNLNTVVTEIDSMLRRLIGEDVELVLQLAPDLGNAKADGGQMQQVLMNLAVNARDAMPQGGTLMIETSNAFLDDDYCESHPEVRPGPYIQLAVSDTGTGMTPEVQQRAFEPFFTTKPVGSGTGLGLSTVHGMIRQSGGWIWVYSEPGSGTTFKIYLPRTDEAVLPAPANVKTDLHGSETILVVEDQEEVRVLAVAILERYGYRVLSAAGAEEAIALAKVHPGTIDLLLTDIIMPGMNGRALARQLAADRPLRVLYMSGYTENAIAHRGILDPGLDYIQKPFTPEALAEKVRAVLGTISQ